MEDGLERIIDAVTNATLLKPDLLTGDAINAIAGGHGMLNLSVFCTANVIADKILQGQGLKLKASNQERIDLNSVIDEGVKAAVATGADPSNAALITASLCYLAGSNVRAGVPSGNRKLGALCRLSAGAQRGGVLSLPTPKGGNKISAFPAVLKIYEAMMEGNLTRINGAEVPGGILGTPLSGHSTLGEDYIFSEVAENAAAIGARAMMKAYAGAGMKPNPFISAVFGAAAALEICHPDAAMPERFGPSFKIYTPYVAGFGAVKAVGLPETLHFRVTGEEFNTANLIGDLGIILKDMGTPTIIGMLAFYEMFACFSENALIGTGSSGGPKTAPIGHVAADATLALRTIAKTGSVERAAEIIEKNKHGFFDPELAAMEVNTIARKVEELQAGPVSRAVILATTAVTRKAIAERVRITVEGIRKGKTLTEIVMSLEEKRIGKVEANASAMMSKNLNKKIEIKITKITGGARRQGKISMQYFALDPNVDVLVKVDGKETVLKNFCHEVIPDAVLNKKEDILQLLPIVSPAVGELLVTGHTLVDLVVPVATAVLQGKGSPEDLSEEAVSRYSMATGGLPGGAQRAAEVARLAVQFYREASKQGNLKRTKERK
jgi:hypothetical protein